MLNPRLNNNRKLFFRTGKPFNPLLGETFECDRMEDLGWRSISEQVNECSQKCD